MCVHFKYPLIHILSAPVGCECVGINLRLLCLSRCSSARDDRKSNQAPFYPKAAAINAVLTLARRAALALQLIRKLAKSISQTLS